MDNGVDTGDIVAQTELRIRPEDTAHTLYQRLLDLEVELFRSSWALLASGNPPRKPQSREEGTSHTRADLGTDSIRRLDAAAKVQVEELLRRLRALTTNDRVLAERAARFRNHGISSDAMDRFRGGEWYYEMADLGFNYRLTDLQCALGLSQLKKLDRFLVRREAIAARYRDALSGVPGLSLQAVAPHVRHAWHIFPVLLELERLAADRRAIFSALRAEGIGVSVHYIPVYWHPYYQRLGYQKGLCPVAEGVYERLLTLPLFPAMEDRDVEDVIAAVTKVLENFSR